MQQNPDDKRIHNASEIPPEVIAKFSLFARAQVIAMIGTLVKSDVTVGRMLNTAFALLNHCQAQVQEFCEENNLCCGCCGGILYANINHSFWRTLSVNLNKMAGLERLSQLSAVPVSPEDLAQIVADAPALDPTQPKKRDASPDTSAPQTPGVN